jgi:hypothetical protein
MSDTLEELEVKLAENQIQLMQVQQLLAAAPTDETLLQLHSDIVQAMQLVNEAKQFKNANSAPPPLPSIAPPPLPSNFEAAPSTAVARSAASIAALINSSLKSGNGTSSYSSSSSSNSNSSVVSSIAPRKWQPGERCMALWSGDTSAEHRKYYAARVESVTELSTYHVCYLDYNSTAELPYTHLQPYTPAPTERLKPGALVRALWPEDGLMYDAIVEAIPFITPSASGSASSSSPSTTSGVVSGPGTGLRVAVKFSKYKKTKMDVDVYDVVLRKGKFSAEALAENMAAAAPPAAIAAITNPTGTALGAASESKMPPQRQLSKKQQAQRDEEDKSLVMEKFIIPEHLRPLAADNEQQKASKLKKIKHLKSRHRSLKLEKQGLAKQSNWNAFLKKSDNITAKAQQKAHKAVQDVDSVVNTAELQQAQAAAAYAYANDAAASYAAAAAANAAVTASGSKSTGSRRALGKHSLASVLATSKKRKSIFSSPDDVDGRVGVTGSGKSMTDYRDPAKHKHAKLTNLADTTQAEIDAEAQLGLAAHMQASLAAMAAMGVTRQI